MRVSAGSLRSRVALWQVVLIASASPLMAQQTPAPETKLSYEEARAKTEALFSKSCATCHNTGPAVAPEAGAATGTVLDLDQLTTNRSLVKAGLPDASPLYHVLLGAHAPVPAFTGKVPEPTAVEIEAVRDWIEQIPNPGNGCAGREPVSAQDGARLADEWRKLAGASGAKLRFISLIHLYNACRNDAELAAVREALSPALASLSGATEGASVESIGELSLIAAVDPQAAGLTTEHWEELTRLDPRGAADGISADWLVAEAHRRKPLPATEPVALDYTSPVDAITASAELGEDQGAFLKRLAGLEGQEGKLARRLLQGSLPRDEWLKLAAHLKGKISPVFDTGAVPAGRSENLRLSLWSDKLTYKAGDLASFTAIATTDCYLTLIGIDMAGVATVLFPNDLDGENFLRAGSSMTVPVQGASYQLRFKERGEEMVAGVCSAPGKRPRGIAHNFEKQRFTVLGPWRAFLHELPEREAAIAKTERRANRGSAEAGNENAGPQQEARAAIRITIE